MKPIRVIPVMVASVGLLTATLRSPEQADGHDYSFGGTGTFEVTVTGPNSIRIKYSLPELALRQSELRPGEFFSATAPGHHQLNDPGQPELPVITRLIDVPEFSSYKVQYSSVRTRTIRPGWRGVTGQLFPSQPSLPKSQERERQRFVIDEETYKARRFSRTDTLLIERAGLFRDRHLAAVTIIPGRYNPGRNLLEVITSAEIDITFTPSGGKGTPGSPVEEMADDPKSGKSFSPEYLINGYSENPTSIVILTDTAFRKQIEPLIKWKTIKGLNVITIYRGETLAGTTFAALKDTLGRVYDAVKPEYLLIIGDLSVIPRSDGTLQLSDMYYGEFSGDGDYIPEMYIGRVPAKDTSQVRSFVTKLLQYERQESADTSNYNLRALVTAGNDGGYSKFMNGQVNYATTYYLNSGNGFITTSFLHPQSAAMDDSVKKVLNRGVGFVNYSGHGNVNRWDDPTFTNTDAAALTNTGRYPFVISNACLTGQFSSEVNLGRSLVLAPERGAVGFIGCTNDSYWSEDYYYAVGAGEVLLQPVYSPSELGFYDRFFHLYGELPSQWHYTMGQVNFAGLMAVTESTTGRKRYYWETYSLIGDPSVVPVIGHQTTLTINLPDTMPAGLSNLTFDAPPFTYVAVSDFNNLWDASFVSPTGFVSLDLPENKGDSCLVVITGQGIRPFFKTIRFGETASSWLSADSFTIDDASGNNNGKADYGETVYIGLKISNPGGQPSSGAFALLSSSSEWITVISDSVFIGNIPAGESINLSKAFTVRMGSTVPDKGIISLEVRAADDDTVRMYRHDIVAQAPDMKILSLRFDDTETGNGNRLPDRGESLFLVFTVKNVGSSDAEGFFRISNSPAGFAEISLETATGIIESGTTTEVRVPARVSLNSFPGMEIPVETMIDCGFYSNTRTFEIPVGKTRESFEYDQFNIFPWINNSAVPWVVTESYSYHGSNSAMSGAISNNASSILQMNIYLPERDTLTFWYKVSSESNYDFFRFLVNGAENIKESGEKDWREKILVLEAGAYLLEWQYSKDASVSAGMDRAMIDLIDFPESAFAIRDIEMSEIISPVLPEGTTTNDTIEVKIRNLGGGAINGFNLAYTVNNSFPPVEQYFPETIPFRDSVTVKFEKPVNLSRYGIYNITVYSFNNDDDFLANDTIRIRIENTGIREDARVYPNPVVDRVTLFIRAQADEQVELKVTSASGKLVSANTRNLAEGENYIDIPVQNLPAGNYIISLKGAFTKRQFTIIKL